jgi:hypothetical protein
MVRHCPHQNTACRCCGASRDGATPAVAQQPDLQTVVSTAVAAPPVASVPKPTAGKKKNNSLKGFNAQLEQATQDSLKAYKAQVDRDAENDFWDNLFRST